MASPGAVVTEMMDKLYECSPASIAFENRPKNAENEVLVRIRGETDILSWFDIRSKYEDDKEKSYDRRELAARISDLEHDFNALCYNALICHQDWSQGSMNRKALDLFQKGQKVLADRSWTDFRVCSECGSSVDDDRDLVFCDHCCHGETGALTIALFAPIRSVQI